MHQKQLRSGYGVVTSSVFPTFACVGYHLYIHLRRSRDGSRLVGSLGGCVGGWVGVWVGVEVCV